MISSRFNGLPMMKNRIVILVLAAAALFFTGQSSQAADGSWNVNAAGTWSVITSSTIPWLSGTAPGSTTTNNPDVATFSNTLTADRLVTVDANRFIGGLSFGNTSAFKYTLQTGILHLNNGGVIQTLAANGNHTDTISSAIVIEGDGGAATFTAGASSATSLLSIGAVTGVSSGLNVTTLTLNGTNTGANAITGIIGNGSVGGNLAVVKDGAGTWTLSGSNTYSGGTTISAGTVKVGSATALGASTGTVSVAAGAALDLNGKTMTNTNALTLNGTGISGGGALIASTAGTYAGPITLGNSGVAIGGTGGGVTLATTATIVGASTGYNLNLQGVGGTINSIINGGTSGVAGAGAVIVNTTGTWTLSGANTYTGGLIIKSGTVQAGNVNALGSDATLGAGKGAVTLGDSSGSADATLWLNLGGTYNNPITVAAGSGNRTIYANNASGYAVNGAIDLNNNLILNDVGGYVLTLGGKITQRSTGLPATIADNAGKGPAINGDIEIGTGGLTIQNNNSGWAGYLNPALVIGGNITSTTTGNLTFNGSNGGFTVTSPSINNSGTITNSGSGSGTTTISGTIGANVTGLIQNSATSKFILSGAKTYNGPTTITLGTLQIGTAGSLNSGSYTGNISNDGTFLYSSSTNQTLSGNITGTGSLTKDTATTSKLILSGTNTYSGTTTVTAGTLQANLATSLPGYNSAGKVICNGGTIIAPTGDGSTNGWSAAQINTLLGNTTKTTGTLVIDTTNTSITLNPTGSNFSGGISLTKLGSNTLTLGGTNSFTGTVTISAGELQLGSATPFNQTAGLENALTFGAATSGTLTLNGNSVTVASLNGSGTGTVVQNASVTSGTMTVGNSLNAASTYAGTIKDGTGGGTLAVVKNGTNTLTISGSNSYTGPTAINGGIVKISAANNLGDSTKATNTISFNNGGTLESTANSYDLGSNRAITLNGAGTIQSDAGTLTVSGAIGGPGSLTKTGTGTIILSGLNNYGGTTTITQGTLRLASNGAALGKIICSGDSITVGYKGTHNGYRDQLFSQLQSAGYSAVQTLDALSGQNTAYILNGFTPTAQGGSGWMSANPQIILLLIGINDRSFTDGTDISMIPAVMIEYGKIIDTIYQQSPTVRLYVGKLTPCNAYVTTFNTNLVTLVQAKQAAGDNISIVDLNTNFPANSLADGLHPNDNGYAWMAQQWFNAISADHPVVSANILPATTAISLASGATLDLGGVSQTVASLADSGTTAITNSATTIPVTLTINPPAGSTTYSGAISDSGTANAISLVKSGAGTQVLAGTNSYSGGTTITGGILNISADTNLGTTAGALTFNGGTLQLGAGVTINASRLVTLTASGGVVDTQANTGTIAASIGGVGGLTKVGNGTLILTGSNSYSGSTTVNSGTLSLATPSLADAADVFLATGAVLNLNFSGTDTIDALFIDGVCQPSGTWGAIGSAATHTTALITGTGLLNVSTGPSFASWINGFSSLSVANRALTANPSGDGINNLLKYALGGDPTVASQSILPRSGTTSGKLSLTFTRTLANTDITMTVRASDSLTGTWTDLASSVNGAAMSALIDGVVVIETGTGATRTVEVRDLYLTSDPNHTRRFMRMQVLR